MWERYPISSLWTPALHIFMGYLKIEHPWEIALRKTKNEVSYIIFPAPPPQLRFGGQRWELCSISFLRRYRHRCISQSHAEHYFKDIWSFPLKLRGNLCFKETFGRCKHDAYWQWKLGLSNLLQYHLKSTAICTLWEPHEIHL